MLEKEKEGKEEKKGRKRGKHSVMSSSLVNIFLGFLKNLFIIPELKASQKVKMPKPKNKKAALLTRNMQSASRSSTGLSM